MVPMSTFRALCLRNTRSLRTLPAARFNNSAFPSTSLPARGLASGSFRNGFRKYSTQPQNEKEQVASGASQSTSQGVRDRAAVGPFNWRAGLFFVLTGVGLYYYFETEKAKVKERRLQEIKESKRFGKARIGGPFSLISAKTNTPFTEKDLLGKWSLVYFGFTNCPDICPEELDKMSAVVDEIDKKYGEIVNPVFISCDPARDSVEQTKRYVSDFHPRMIGLTGEYENVKAACKVYRVYFSTPPNTKPGDDYLVDHSIFFYLMDPEGHFVEAFGKVATKDDVLKKFEEEFGQWEQRKKEIDERRKEEAKLEGK